MHELTLMLSNLSAAPGETRNRTLTKTNGICIDFNGNYNSVCLLACDVFFSGMLKDTSAGPQQVVFLALVYFYIFD